MIIIYLLIVYKDIIVQIFQNQHCIQNTLNKKNISIDLFITKWWIPKRHHKYELHRLFTMQIAYIQELRTSYKNPSKKIIKKDTCYPMS